MQASLDNHQLLILQKHVYIFSFAYYAPTYILKKACKW